MFRTASDREDATAIVTAHRKDKTMIQDIAPLHLNNQYQKRQPVPSDYVLAFRENAVCIHKSLPEGGEDGENSGLKQFPERLEFPTFEEMQDWCGGQKRPLPALIYLFEIGGKSFFLADLPEGGAEGRRSSGAESSDTEPGQGEASEVSCHEYVRMFDIRRIRPKELVLAAATAWHLYLWYRDNRFCGRCGHPTEQDGKLRMLRCPACGNMIFPKIAPAVIVGVTDGERILMTKYANRDYKRYALIAGFTEIGETAEETVRREVFEEVGLRVKNIRYYKSQQWGFDSNLLLGYFCELDDTHEIRLDEEELSVAEWVHYSEIPDDEEGLSLTREMMTVFRDCARGDFLP